MKRAKGRTCRSHVLLSLHESRNVVTTRGLAWKPWKLLSSAGQWAPGGEGPLSCIFLSALPSQMSTVKKLKGMCFKC